MIKENENTPLAPPYKGGAGSERLVSDVIDSSTRKIIYGWLTFAISSLIFAGIFAFLVVMSRTPVIFNLFPRTDYIRVALVGHVILSFVIWFLAFEGLLWTLTSTVFLRRGLFCKHSGWAGLLLAISGTILVVITAIAGLGEPKFVNYIPVLTHPVFYAGLILLFAGMTITLLNTFLTVFTAWREKTYEGRLPLFTYGMLISGTAFMSAVTCFALSYYFHILSPLRKIPVNLETLFWGGGHIQQFTNTITMVTVWLFMTYIVFKKMPVKETFSKLLFTFYLIFILPAPFIYFLYDTSSLEYTRAFTKLMEYGLGPSTGIFAIAILFTIVSKGVRELPWRKPEFSSLVLSMFLFALGGIISLTIYGYNTKIPAHYHGAIGGVTIAFMGFTNYVFSLLKKDTAISKLAVVYPYVYGVGQSLFVIGMFIAGSHGVARKTFGAAQQLDNTGKIIGMAITGFGGFIAILGGILFIIYAIKRLTQSPDTKINEMEFTLEKGFSN